MESESLYDDLSLQSIKFIWVTDFWCSANLGLYTIQHLARKGATVYMGARDEDRAKEAIDLLQSEGLGPGNGEVRWLDLDLGDPLKTRKAGEEFLKLESRLDILGEWYG